FLSLRKAVMVAVDAAMSGLQRRCRSAAKIGRRYLRPWASDQRSVVFVAGQQRSGTNMLMDVLDRHQRTDVYHETDVRAFERYQMRDIATIRTLVDRSRASHVVIKALCELQRLRDLLDAFPRSYAIWLVRHYHDVSSSMARQFSSTAEVLKRMRADPVAGGWRGERMAESVRMLLNDCIADDTDEISAAAFQWFMRNHLYFDQDLRRDRRVRIVFYEDLATRPEATFAAVAAFLEIGFHPSLTSEISARSVDKADKPPIDPRIEALCRQLHDRLLIAAQTQH
ncbi:MAG: sulfotransferase domain-containing protein, partial [Geminicoccaceae bacterium]